jgi:hypothetical protein
VDVSPSDISLVATRASALDGSNLEVLAAYQLLPDDLELLVPVTLELTIHDVEFNADVAEALPLALHISGAGAELIPLEFDFDEAPLTLSGCSWASTTQTASRLASNT